jgi:hypothetical protein
VKLVALALLVLAVQGAQPQLPKSQVPTLGRPTKPDDPAPVLDFGAYFNGTWQFAWEFPDSALGPAGTLTGTTAFKVLSDSTFEAVSNATGESGPVTIREVITYQRDKQTLSRDVTDSRGFSYTQSGTVAGDLGGQFTIRLESAPFVHNGRTIRLKSVQRLLSPLNYRTQTTIAVDDGPFENFGNPWWSKEESLTRRHIVVSIGTVLPPTDKAAIAPGETPTDKAPIVAVSGCLTQQAGNTWVLASATEPVASAANGPAPKAPVTGPLTGTGEFALLGISEFDLPSHKGHTVLVKALLIKAAPINRLNVTSVTHVAPTCPPPPK